MNLTQTERERYSRHLRVPGFGEEEQTRLKQGSVLAIGAGGLGSPALLYLAAAGVGRIGIADFDRVELHNLQRQVLYTSSQVGKLKTETAKERLLALNPTLKIELHSKGISPENARSLFRSYDVILDGSDNFDTRYLVNDASFLEKKPLVYGSVFRLEGQIMVLNAGDHCPCYRCLFPEPPAPGTVPNCNEAGVIGALCGVIGSMQAMEVIKLLSGFGKVMTGVLTKVDLFHNRQPSIRLIKDPDCPLCSAHPRIRDLHTENYSVPCALPDVAPESLQHHESLPSELSVEQAHALLKSENAVLLDVREPDELAICRIENSISIPMGQIPGNLQRIPKDRTVIVYCHHGMRSLRTVQYLRSMGIPNCTNMRGGIDAWANKFDPSMKRY